ncbi:hypothetical protein HED60_04450 [Planctomycetales bacterium ZRK34]|nr:hypothetical protein HED60_04450 [Planctomycetales bacterium ZRK34]
MSMTSDQRQLLKQIHDRDATVKKPSFMRRSRYQFVIDHGHWYAPTPCPDTMARGDKQQCFKNALELASDDEYLYYVEGFALYSSKGLIVHHAWITDGSGRAIDPTWDQPGVAYAGVPFKMDFVLAAAIADHSVNSVLDDYGNYWPILGELGERSEEWLEPRGFGVLGCVSP